MCNFEKEGRDWVVSFHVRSKINNHNNLEDYYEKLLEAHI